MRFIGIAIICLIAALPVYSEEKPAHNKAGLFLPGEIVTGNEITVRGRRVAIIEEAGTGTKITGEDIRRHADKTLDETLSAIPGILVDTHTKGYTRLRIRGFEQDRILIMMDGIPVNDVYSTDFDISTIPVVNIAKIIINRGASSALYGAGSAVGVINIVSRRPEQAYAEARCEYGQYGNWTLSAAGGAPISNAYFWFTGSLINSDGFRSSAKLGSAERRKWFDRLIPYQLYGLSFDQLSIPAKDSYINDTGLWDHSNYRKYDTAGKVGYDFINGETGVLARYNYKTGRTNTYEPICTSEYKSPYGYWQEPIFRIARPEDVKKAALRERAFVWPEMYTLQVAPYVRYATGGFEFKTIAYVSYRSAIEQGYASVDHQYIKDQAAVLTGTANDPYNDIKTYTTIGENAVISIKPLEAHRLSFGFTWKDDRFTEKQQAISADLSPHIAATSYGTNPYNVQFLEAAYLSLAFEYEMKLVERVFLTAGISYGSQDFKKFKRRHDLFVYDDAYIVRDDSTITGTRDAFNPVGGMVIEAIPDLVKLRGAASQKTRFPTLGEYAKIEQSRDANLKPEKIHSINGGAEFSLFRGALVIASDYYYTRVRDRIKKIAGGTEPPVNIERVVSQGIENSIRFSLKNMGWLQRADVTGAYTYLHARNYDDSPANKGMYLDYTPAHQCTVDIQCTFISGTQLAIWGEHTTGAKAYVMRSRPPGLDTSVPFSTTYYGTVDLHNPWFMNIKLSQQIGKNLSLYLLGKNLLDDYRTDPFNPGPGRMLYAGILGEW